jgi:hypothetical protein
MRRRLQPQKGERSAQNWMLSTTHLFFVKFLCLLAAKASSSFQFSAFQISAFSIAIQSTPTEVGAP